MATAGLFILLWPLLLLLIEPMVCNYTISIPEFRDWAENRYIDCIFCIDYDNFKRISVTGCASTEPVTCRGNVCFMRQHKSNVFFLYTSGCLNLTMMEYEEIAQQRRDLSEEKPNDETLLCEVSKKANTCLCTDSSLCNNVSLPAAFSEFHTAALFGRLRFHEMLHFRMFIPNEPVLRHSDVNELDQLLHYYIPGYSASSIIHSSLFSLSIVLVMLL